MSRYQARRRGLVWAGAAVVMTVLALLSSTSPAMGGTYATLSGSGSSWASVALVQWANDLASNGLTVNFLADGSASGRGDYSQGSQVDFAASDPPFRNGKDELANTGAENPSYGYSYVPDVGGGTAFMYHITVGGHLVTNLRLSGETIMKIFTGQITNWSDPAITKDYGAQLPNEPIIPVIRSDGSGATFFFTRWMHHVFPNDWDAFCQKAHPGIQLPCPETEFYPQFGNAKAENGSNAVSVYVTSNYGEGSIGYDEYAYALNAHWPVAYMENPGGYYVLPTASDVAVALTQAQINENASSTDFLQQNLDNVYGYTDPRSYPLSSYSYLIVPRNGTKIPPIFNSNVGRSLSTYIDYYLCAGQKEAASLGYSPLPLNLVQGGLQQVNQIPGHVTGPDPTSLAGCDNPTFTNGVLTVLKDAPYPGKCQKVGSPLNCGTPGATTGRSTTGTSKTGKGTKSTAGTGGTTGGTGTGPGSSTGTVTAGSTPVAQNADVTGSVVDVPGNGADRILLAVITALGVAAAVAAPPSVAAYMRRRRGGAAR